MAYGATKVNPASTTLNVETGSVNLLFFTVDYINAVNGSAGPNGAQQAVLTQIQSNATIVHIGPLLDSNTQQTFAVESAGGDFPSAKYDGTNSESWAADLEDRIQALGTVDGVDLSSATVTATKLGILTAAAVA